VLLLNISMVHSSKVTIIADSKHQTGISFTLGETVRFDSLEFITDRFGRLSLSDKGNVLGPVFVGMAHSGSPSLHTILKDSVDKGDTPSSGGRSFDFPISRECNVVAPSIPIKTAPRTKGTSTHLTIATVPLWTTASQPDHGLTPEQQCPPGGATSVSLCSTGQP
jgi:hypothetical protein